MMMVVLIVALAAVAMIIGTPTFLMPRTLRLVASSSLVIREDIALPLSRPFKSFSQTPLIWCLTSKCALNEDGQRCPVAAVR